MQRDASNRNAREKVCNFPRQNSRKLCDGSDQKCVVPVLLHLLQRRCVSLLASGKLGAAQRAFSSRARTKFSRSSAQKRRYLANGTRQSEAYTHRLYLSHCRAQGTITKCIPIENSDVKKVDRCSSLALNHHCVFQCMNIIINTCVGELYPSP